jgi:6-pyruvoyl tetrahydropterin synthase/QueD family protein
MYVIYKSIDIDFSHHVRGHSGPCVNIHGHTWKFEVGLQATELSAEGFVVDFKLLKSSVLQPCHRLLDHGLALGAQTYDDVAQELSAMGKTFVESRRPIHGRIDTSPTEPMEVGGAEARYPGGIKVAVFPFDPTSERLARWLYELAKEHLDDDRVSVAYARVYETLHPVEAVAEYRPEEQR